MHLVISVALTLVTARGGSNLLVWPINSILRTDGGDSFCFVCNHFKKQVIMIFFQKCADSCSRYLKPGDTHELCIFLSGKEDRRVPSWLALAGRLGTITQ